MKKFNLSLIILICGTFVFMPNSCHANTTSSVVKCLSNLAVIVPDGDTDPDWDKLITHLIDPIVIDDSKT